MQMVYKSLLNSLSYQQILWKSTHSPSFILKSPPIVGWSINFLLDNGLKNVNKVNPIVYPNKHGFFGFDKKI